MSINIEEKTCKEMQIFNENHDEEDSTKSGNRKSLVQVQYNNKVPCLKEQMETSMKLLQFVADTQLTLTQINGQRKLGPPPGWTGPPPGPKCEIFVGSIPRNYYEPEIVYLFSSIGTIYELRLMMDFSGMNRGYCFIMYSTEEEAARAVEKLDQYEIYPGKRIGVVASINNCRLYIGQLPRNIDSKIIVKRIYEITDDVDKVAIYRMQNGFISYVLVSYKTHRSAAMARRRLVPESATLFKNHEVNVEWAKPNVSPCNMFEECGILDQHGNVLITQTFIEPKPVRKVVSQTKSSCNKQSSNHTWDKMTHETQNFDATIRKGRPIKAAKQNLSSNHLQKCSSHSTDLSKKQRKMNAWDINGNLKNGCSDKSLLYKSLQQRYTEQLNPVLPSISAYLNKSRHFNRAKLNDAQNTAINAVRMLDIQNFTKNLPQLSRDFCNYQMTPCRCGFYVNDLSSQRSNEQELWSPVDLLVPKFSDTLNIVNGNENCQLSGFQYTNYLNQLPHRDTARNYQEPALNREHILNVVETTPMEPHLGLIDHRHGYDTGKNVNLSNDISINQIGHSRYPHDPFTNMTRFDDRYLYEFPTNSVSNIFQ